VPAQPVPDDAPVGAPDHALAGRPDDSLELELIGRITTASNATFLARLGDVEVVYKPVSGEKPLWDFPDGTLADREAAAFIVSEVLGGGVVPRTWLRDGPLGPGMVQLWQTVDQSQDAVDLVAANAVPATGWRRVFDGHDDEDRPVALIHEDTPALRRMAVFDVIANNADRKGGHVLPLADGHRHGVDHGLTFHAEHKLRTVLWGWIDEPLTDDELAGVERVLAALTDGGLVDTLSPLLTDDEIVALADRCERLLGEARFPAPDGYMPAVPWPIF
jgi:uncharacterized repeat protein (TIGR03843 family)